MYQFVQANPQEVFIPYWPHVSAMAHGQMHHCGMYVAELQSGGITFSKDLLQNHMPKKMRYIIITDGDLKLYRDSLHHWLPEFNTEIRLKDLPATWTIFVRSDDPIVIESKKWDNSATH